MAFEYSSQDKRLTFPNPLKRHNRFLLAASAIIGVFAILLLFGVRKSFGYGISPYPTIAIALAMVAASVSYLYTCLSQLQFFFGRGRPHGLAPILAADGHGTSPEAERILKESLRQQAIEYREPRGPIAGLLYTLVPNLIYAPSPLRQFAEWQFKGAVTLTTLILGLALTLAINMPTNKLANGNVSDWIGVAFLFAAVWTLVRPFAADGTGKVSSTLLSVEWISGLIAFSVVGPVVISFFAPSLPRVPWVAPFPHVFVFLFAGLFAHGLFFIAIIKQLLSPPATAVSVVQDTWNLSSSPALVTGEFIRAMQESWREKIPNRRYSRIEPRIDLAAQSGTFGAEIIEETQPFPRLIAKDNDDQVEPSGFPLFVLALDIAGLVFIAAAAVTTCLVGAGLMTDGAVQVTAALYAVFCGALGSYAFAAARQLSLRFDFESRLLWFEMNGQYVSARVDQGNVIQGNLRASSSMVQVEGMTFRLWVAELHSVAFGKDAPRHIVAMAGNPEVADGLAARLKDFAQSQASVAALGNAANVQRLTVNTALANRTGSPAAITKDTTAVAGIASQQGSQS